MVDAVKKNKPYKTVFLNSPGMACDVSGIVVEKASTVFK